MDCGHPRLLLHVSCALNEYDECYASFLFVLDRHKSDPNLCLHGACCGLFINGSISDQVVRLVLIGSCDSGKTCLLRRFLGGYFDDADERDYTR